MSDLIPIDAPSLQPLQQSFDYDQLESELKAVFLNVFESMIRDRERNLNLYGMPHLGDDDLIQRALKNAGLSIIRRDATRQSFLLKAALARNPRRGMIFLRAYLQSAWPNVWMCEPLWHPIATADNYPNELTPLGTKTLAQNAGSVITAVYDPESQDGIPTVYRTDWQGQQQLYTTPRTNSLKQSRNLANAAWVQNVGGFWTSAASTTIPAPDGGSANVTKFTATATPNGLFARQTGLALPAGQRTTSVFVFVPLGQNVSSVTFSSDYDDTDTGGSQTVATIGAWVRVSSTAVLSAARSQVDFNIRTDGATPQSGFYFYASCAQEEPGSVPTSQIATGASAVTAPPDYTMDANGLATFAAGDAPPSALTHFRTGRVRVTLPVTTDNGLGLLEIAKAFRSTLAPRLLLELRLSTVFENIGNTGGLALANGATAVMPFMAIGTLS